jgi:hypothetical protein
MSQALKKCPAGKIINPATGRCVKKDGKIGKELMKAKKSKKPKKPKPREDFERVWPKPPKKSKKPKKPKSEKICSDDQILNPATGRCVKKDGKIGKQLLGEKPAKKKPAKKKAKKKSVKKKPAKKSKTGAVRVVLADEERQVWSYELTYKKMIIQNNETLKSYKSGKGIFTINVDCEDTDGCGVDIDIENTVSVEGKNNCKMTLAKLPGTFGREARYFKMNVSLDDNERILNINVYGGINCTQLQRARGGLEDVDVEDKLDFVVKLYLTVPTYKSVKNIFEKHHYDGNHDKY